MELLQQVGAYAGLASIVGLAVLSALYFSQARDLRRLREWAGRAPERAAAPVVPPAAAPVPKPATQPAGQTSQQTAVVPVPGIAQQAAGSQASSGTATAPPPAPAAAGAANAAGAKSTGAAETADAAKSPGAAGGNGQGSPPRVPPPVPIRTGAGATSGAPRLPGGEPAARPPWYRRLAPRYVALVVAGLLVIGAGAAYALGALDGLTTPGGGAPTGAEQGATEGAATGGRARSGGAVDPSSVTFAVLNGTQVDGLAKQVADKLESSGYRRGNVTNATEQQKAESAVLYASGARREAAAVARRLDISQIERVDPASQSLAGDATVIVIVGSDQTP